MVNFGEGLGLVVLVADVTDEVFDKVLERDDAVGPAVLVDDGQMRALSRIVATDEEFLTTLGFHTEVTCTNVST